MARLAPSTMKPIAAGLFRARYRALHGTSWD
jgi:hypothetical protein